MPRRLYCAGAAGPGGAGVGDFINALIAFLIVATVLFFFVIKPANALLSRLRTEPPVAEETHQCPECLSEIPIAARRCAFCTTQVAAAA
jgi:large conductance mechanosensitive channel